MSDQPRKPNGIPIGGQWDNKANGAPATEISYPRISYFDDRDDDWISEYNKRGCGSFIDGPVPVNAEQHYAYYFEDAIIPNDVASLVAGRYEKKTGVRIETNDARELLRGANCLKDARKAKTLTSAEKLSLERDYYLFNSQDGMLTLGEAERKYNILQAATNDMLIPHEEKTHLAVTNLQNEIAQQTNQIVHAIFRSDEGLMYKEYLDGRR